MLKCLKKNIKLKGFFLSDLVKGDVHDRSDIDIVVEGLRPELYIKALVDADDIVEGKEEINLIPFEDAFESLKERALKEGELIYE